MTSAGQDEEEDIKGQIDIRKREFQKDMDTSEGMKPLSMISLKKKYVWKKSSCTVYNSIKGRNLINLLLINNTCRMNE